MFVYDEKGEYTYEKDGLPKLIPIEGEYRFLEALAKTAFRKLPFKEAVKEWEKVTGENSLDAGCPCCGNPHNFTEYDDKGKIVEWGPDTDYVCNWR